MSEVMFGWSFLIIPGISVEMLTFTQGILKKYVVENYFVASTFHLSDLLSFLLIHINLIVVLKVKIKALTLLQLLYVLCPDVLYLLHV